MHADENERLIPKQSKSYYVLVVAIIVAVLLAGALAWYFYQRDDAGSELLLDPSEFGEDAAPGTVQREAGKEIVEPPPLAATEASEYDFPEKLPDLEDSDAELQTQLESLSESEELPTWLQSDDVARKGVAVAYALADGEVAYEYLSLPAPKGKFKAKSKANKTYIDAENFQRYEPIVRAVDLLNVDYAAAFYRHYWPLFRTAFAELGEPEKSLQEEVLAGINLLLETPEVEGDIELTRPSVYYKFADKDLEKLKPAQKLLLRMGPENRAVIKAKLQALRERLEFDATEAAGTEDAAAETTSENADGTENSSVPDMQPAIEE